MPTYNEDPARIVGAAARHAARDRRAGRRRGLRPLHPQRHQQAGRLAGRAGDGRRRPRRPGDRTAAVFYRHRARNLRRKAGNIADWVERWGGAYPFMLVLDADSLMEADTIIELARRMEADDDLGILQTSPQPDRRGDAARPGPAVRQPRLRPGADPRPARLVRQRRQLLGPQRHHPHPGLRRLRRPARAAAASRRSAA